MRSEKTDITELSGIPDDALEALARSLYPAMVAFFESDEGQREFAEWQSQQSRGEQLSPANEKLAS